MNCVQHSSARCAMKPQHLQVTLKSGARPYVPTSTSASAFAGPHTLQMGRVPEHTHASDDARKRRADSLFQRYLQLPLSTSVPKGDEPPEGLQHQQHQQHQQAAAKVCSGYQPWDVRYVAPAPDPVYVRRLPPRPNFSVEEKAHLTAVRAITAEYHFAQKRETDVRITREYNRSKYESIIEGVARREEEIQQSSAVQHCR